MTKQSHQVKTIIIGGGHAGVNLACMLELAKKDRNYLVLERDDSLLVKWRKYRWEEFNLNTPVKFGLLYGQEDERLENDQWLLERPMEGELERWDKHISKVGVKHKLHSNVVNVATDQGDYLTTVEEKHPENREKSIVTYRSKNVVVCNGYYDQATFPAAMAESIPSYCNIKQQLPAGFKFNDLVDGNILLIGSGQTGVQMADLLLHHRPDRKLYMSTSSVPGCPRSIQGRDIFDWLEETKFLFLPRSWLDGLPHEQFEAKRYAKAPVTGPTKDISPFSLHRRGVELFGHLDRVETSDGGSSCKLHFKATRPANLQASLAGYQAIFDMVKKHAKLSPDIGNAPEWNDIEPELLNEPGRMSIDVRKENITNIIWCTGWSRDFSFLNGVPGIEQDLDERTNAPDVIVSKTNPGLFYCGFPWVGTAQSLNIVNFNADAKVIMDGLRN